MKGVLIGVSKEWIKEKLKSEKKINPELKGAKLTKVKILFTKSMKKFDVFESELDLDII